MCHSLWKNSSCKAKSVLHGTTNGQRFWGLMLQSLNVINFWPGNSKSLAWIFKAWIRPGFFDQGCQESSALEVTRPGRPSFGGLGCQESLAVAILARPLLGRIFPVSLAKKPESLGWPVFWPGSWCKGGSYNCTCRPGYTGNGSLCEGKNLGRP